MIATMLPIARAESGEWIDDDGEVTRVADGCQHDAGAWRAVTMTDGTEARAWWCRVCHQWEGQ
jgi:hypothetical protein